MKKVLILCAREWAHPKAGLVENYLFEVFSRIAVRGHRVAWVSGQGQIGSHAGRPRIEFMEGIQVAHLGAGPLYRPFVRMMLARVGKEGIFGRKFDVMIDCVTGRPMRIHEAARVLVLPIAFWFSRRVHLAKNPPTRAPHSLMSVRVASARCWPFPPPVCQSLCRIRPKAGRSSPTNRPPFFIRRAHPIALHKE